MWCYIGLSSLPDTSPVLRAEEKMAGRKVHQKSAQVWAAAANNPAVSSCRRPRKRMAPRMTPQRTGCSPHSFQITIHHLLSLCCVANVCFFPLISRTVGRNTDSKDEARHSSVAESLISRAKVFTTASKRYGECQEKKKKKIWWLSHCNFTSTQKLTRERPSTCLSATTPLCPLIPLFMLDSIHFC